jgi:carnitine-CoA ligase
MGNKQQSVTKSLCVESLKTHGLAHQIYSDTFESKVMPQSIQNTALTPFENMDIRSLLDGQAEKRENHPCLIWEPFEGETQTWSYRELREAIARFAAGLQALGIVAGDRVLIHLNNCPQQIISWLGSAYAGAVPVTTNTASSGEELGYFAQHSNAKVIITEPQYLALFQEAAPQVPDVFVIGDAGDLPNGAKPFHTIDGSLKSLRERGHDPMAPFGIQFTSGTTSRPKAVLWTHANALWGAKVSASHEDLTPNDVHLVYMPLFHTNAQVYSVLASLWVGATFVLQPRFSATRFWPVSLKHKCTFTSSIPFCVMALMNGPIPKDHAYRLWGGPLCDPPTDALFGVKTVGWWGMTETITHGIVGSAHHKDAPMSMGRPSLNYTIHVLDADGQPVKPGETGDLFIGGIRGVSLFLEYAHDPQATRNAFRDDGLFITGDRARLGENGYLYFADRSKDMMKVGGENVAASEVERVIMEVGHVSEVAVVGKPDRIRNEVPVAFVIKKPTAPEDLAQIILASCKKRLATFKVPVEVRLVAEFPRATLNKVAKNQLRAILIAEADAG